MYSKIYEFCKVKNKGNCYQNGSEPTPRVKWLLNLLTEMGIEYELDEFEDGDEVVSKNEDIDIPDDVLNKIKSGLKEPTRPERRERREVRPRRRGYNFFDFEFGGERSVNKFYNIVMRGTSGKFVVAHHDIVNPASDNANDNSCSVINAIMTKKNLPSTTVILLDGEECGGIGSRRASQQMLAGNYGNYEWVLNLELTGKGGKYFFMGDYPGPLSNHIKSVLNPPIVRTPFNDAVIFSGHGIDSVVINPIPPLQIDSEKKESPSSSFGRLGKTDQSKDDDMLRFNDGTPLDFSLLYNCHQMKDSLDTIDPKDMQEFVEQVVLKILA